MAQDNLVAAERKANANKNALEEARTLLEQTDRNRRVLEQVFNSSFYYYLLSIFLYNKTRHSYVYIYICSL